MKVRTLKNFFFSICLNNSLSYVSLFLFFFLLSYIYTFLATREKSGIISSLFHNRNTFNLNNILYDVELIFAYQHKKCKQVLTAKLKFTSFIFLLSSALNMSQQGAALQSYNNELVKCK